MPKPRNLLAAALLAISTLTLAACASGPSVRTDRDPAADFGQYRSFSFYKPIAMEQAGYSSWISERIREDVRREMEARGYRYQPEGGDLLVNFQLVQQERTELWSVPRASFEWIYSYHSRGYVAVPIWYDEPQLSRYREGVLTVDLVDGQRHRLVWTAAVSTPEGSKRAPEKRLAAIDQAITAMFAKYPYRAAN
jgi:hypothetical protein